MRRGFVLRSKMLALVGVALLASCTSREPKRQPNQSIPDASEASEAKAQVAPLAAAASSEGAIGSAALPELSERHVDDRYGYELAFPRGWTASEGAAMPALFVASARESPSDAFVENVNVVVEALPTTLSAEDYADGSAPLLQTDLSEYRELSRTTVELAGQPAVRLEYQHTYQGHPLWVVSYMLVAGPRAYVITATAEQSQLDRWRAPLDAIARSFRLTSG